MFYTVPTNNNGKVSGQAYVDNILEPVVKGWLNRGDSFVLKEDGDSGHRYSKKNPASIWKQQHPQLKILKNCP